MHHLIKGALIALAAVAAFFVYGFTSQVAPVGVAVFAAGSLVGTYIGLAFARVPEGQRRNAGRVAMGAMIVEAAYGTLYVLSLQYPAFFEAPPVWVAVPIAILHGAAFSVLAYFVSLFVVHEGAVDVATPATTLEHTLATLVDRLAPPVATLPSLPDQVAYPRPTQVALVAMAEPQTPDPWACGNCGATATPGQRGAAGKHGHWRCKGCGERQDRQKCD